MPLPLPIFQPDTVPKDYVSQYFENMFFEQAVIEDIDKDKIISILDLLDILIPIKHNPAKKHEYFSITQTVKNGVEYVVFEMLPKKWKGFFSRIKHLVPKKINAPDFGHIEIGLLHRIDKNDLEKIASSAGLLVEEENPQVFLLYKQETNARRLIGRYTDAENNNSLELTVISTHVHNPDHGSLTIENFLKIRKEFGERQFYASLGDKWQTMDKLPIVARDLLRLLNNYIESRIPDIYSCMNFPFRGLEKNAESTSIQSIIDMLLSARRKGKPWKKYFFKTTETNNDISYDVFEARLWDVAVSASRVRYFIPESRENYGYVQASLIQKIKEQALKGITANIPGAGIRSFHEGKSRGFEFIDLDKEKVIGRYILGYYPRNEDDLQEQADDRLEFSLCHENYFSNPKYQYHGFLNSRKYNELMRSCGSKEIFETAFGKWTASKFNVLPALAKEIIEAIDYYIRQRNFKWLDRYSQGGAASGTMTLVRGR